VAQNYAIAQSLSLSVEPEIQQQAFSDVLLSMLYVQRIALEAIGNGEIHHSKRNKLCTEKR
jgi:hypothetical protein